MTGLKGSGPLALVLAPLGRDAAVILDILGSAGIRAVDQSDATMLGATIRDGHAGAAIIAQEALARDDLNALALAVAAQPPWSDFPFILLTTRGQAVLPNPRYFEMLGNVTLIERPSHPMTLVSAVRSALRSRGRQLDAAAHLRLREIAEEKTSELARTLERKVHERTNALSLANDRLTAEIAERRRTEARLIQAQKMEAIGRLTAGVAHDFNNLLTGVVGSMDLLSRRLDDEKQLRLVRTALQAAERGAKLTAQLLAFSRLQRLTPKPTLINDLVSSMSDLLRSTIGGTIRIETRLDRFLWPALVDPSQLELVILNLAINARDAMPSGGRLTIETRNCAAGSNGVHLPDELDTGDYVMISISDDGIGMPPNVLARAFEPFFTTKGVGRGSGLGLSQVYGFARQSGGSVHLESVEGTGTAVSLFLPRGAAATAEATALGDVVPVQRSGAILVVDDDDEVRRVLVELVEELGFSVSASENGRAALEVISDSSTFDLILTDVAMPVMNGPEFAAVVRQRWPHIPILFASGYADLEAFGATLSDEDVVRKPYSLKDLARQIDRILTRPHTRSITA